MNNKVQFTIQKRYARGENKDRVNREVIALDYPEDIHGYLWDLAEKYEKRKCNFIVEHYTQK